MTATKIKGKLLVPQTSTPRPVLSPGDAAVAVPAGPGKDQTTVIYSAPITAERAVTLSTVGAVAGAEVRLVRTAAATGASNVTFAGKNVAAGQWACAVFDGSAWVLSAFGSL